MTLHLNLGIRQLLVKFLQVGLGFDHERLFGDIVKRLRNDIIKPLCLLDELLLHCEEIPVFADRLQQVVEKVVKLLP